MKILINLAGGGIGNNIMTIPLIRTLKKIKGSEISIITAKGKEKIFENEKSIDSLIIYNRNWNLFKKIKFVLSLRKKFDISIVPLPKSGLISLITYFICAKYRIGHNIQKFKFLYTNLYNYSYSHDVDENLNLLNFFNISKDDYCRSIKINLSSKYLNFGRKYISDLKVKNKIVCVHAGAEGKYKCWPLNRYRQLIKKLLKNYTVFYFLGPSEKNLNLNLKIKNFYVIDNLNLVKVYSILRNCDLFIGNDSGMTHLASSSGVKTIAIFGPTNPRFTRPYILNKYIRKANCKYSKDRICRIVLKKDKCNRKCIKNVTVNEVYNTAKKMLK